MATPRTRLLTVFGQDPGMEVEGSALTVQLEIPMERLEAGPRGARVHVIDFDASTNTLYEPLALGADGDRYAKITDAGRLVADQGFHCQNAYAIVMATLARFEQALGRRASWALPGGAAHAGAPPGRGHVVKVAPHAFAEANAYYSRRDEGIFFGYFPGKSGKGNVFSCLSHDVVAHETTHALLDGIRPRYSDPSSPDQAAFHEAFADIVAILSVFRHEAVVSAAFGPGKDRIPAAQLTVEKLRSSTLLGLAKQMGKEMQGIRGNALRQSAELEPSRTLPKQAEFLEPHRRGEILVAAMMNAFLDVWVRRMGPLGLDEGRAVDRSRVMEEGAAAANHLLTMAIRALDYAPPVDLQFGDYLSALLTADRQLYPDDKRYRYRLALIDWFRRYGIDPVNDGSGEPGTWKAPPKEVSLDRNHFESLQRDPDEMFQFVWENADRLELHREAYTYVPSVRPCTRTDVDGFVLRETVAEYVQILTLRADELSVIDVPQPKGMPDDQRVVLYGGGALVFDEFGRLKFHIGSGVASAKQGPRLAYLWESGFFSERTAGLRRFAQLHRERGMQRTVRNGERW